MDKLNQTVEQITPISPEYAKWRLDNRIAQKQDRQRRLTGKVQFAQIAIMAHERGLELDEAASMWSNEHPQSTP